MKNLKIIILILLITSGYFWLIEVRVAQAINEINPKEEKLDSLNYENVIQLMNKHRIKFSRIVLAQSKLESNYLQSNLVKTNKNIFGMRVAAQRYSFATNSFDYGAFAKYATVEDCVRDIKSWQIQNSLFITKEEQYFTLLEKVYCQDKNYVKQLKQLIK